MLTGIILQNFKSFGGSHFIPLAPITLIFGPNSVGKSSVLQSLLLLKQSMDAGSTNSSVLVPTGDYCDLGSFREMVFRRDTDRALEISLAFATDASGDSKYPNVDALAKGAKCTESRVGIGIQLVYDEELKVPLPKSVPVYLCETNTPLYDSRPFLDREIFAEFIEGHHSREGVVRILTVLRHATAHEEHPAWRNLFQTFCQSELDQLREEFRSKNGVETAYINFWGDLGVDEANHDLDFSALSERLANYEFDDFMEDFVELAQVRANLEHFLLHLADSPEKPIRSEERGGQYSHSKLLEFLRGGSPKPGMPILTAVTEELRQQQEESLSRLVYIGPARKFPDRYVLATEALAKSVGHSGRYVPDVLALAPHLLGLTNQELARLGIDYEVELTRLRSDKDTTEEVVGLRLKDRRTGLGIGLQDVGYGVGQVLPVVVQTTLAKRNLVLIEQPELHLHPKVQAELGRMFADAIVEGRDNQFIIETHSEHLVLRLQRLVRRRRLKPSDIAVLYVERDSNGEETGAHVRHLRIDEDGDFIDDWPGGFFEESFEEIFGL